MFVAIFLLIIVSFVVIVLCYRRVTTTSFGPWEECPVCKYSLEGLKPRESCPECGTPDAQHHRVDTTRNIWFRPKLDPTLAFTTLLIVVYAVELVLLHLLFDWTIRSFPPQISGGRVANINYITTQTPPLIMVFAMCAATTALFRYVFKNRRESLWITLVAIPPAAPLLSALATWSLLDTLGDAALAMWPWLSALLAAAISLAIATRTPKPAEPRDNPHTPSTIARDDPDTR